MRILLDHCIPAELAAHIRGHETKTARQLGWHEFKDSRLLEAAEGHFDVLLTVDSSLRFQQMVGRRQLSVLVLQTVSNRTQHLARLIPEIHRVLSVVGPGEVRLIGA